MPCSDWPPAPSRSVTPTSGQAFSSSSDEADSTTSSFPCPGQFGLHRPQRLRGVIVRRRPCYCTGVNFARVGLDVQLSTLLRRILGLEMAWEAEGLRWDRAHHGRAAGNSVRPVVPGLGGSDSQGLAAPGRHSVTTPRVSGPWRATTPAVATSRRHRRAGRLAVRPLTRDAARLPGVVQRLPHQGLIPRRQLVSWW